MPRKTALEVLKRVEREHAYSHIALANSFLARPLSGRDRGLATEIVYGTLTRQRTLDTMLGPFVKRGMRGLDRGILIVLRMALYQLVYLDRIPAHAIVDEAVNLAKGESGKGASGLVNGVLRNILRNREKLQGWDEADAERRPVRYLAERYSLPDWLANRLIQHYGGGPNGAERARAVADAYCQRPDLYLRLLKGNSAELLEIPEGVQEIEGVPGAFRVAGFGEELRAGLEDHRWVVQDLGSQLIGWFVDAQPGDNVLDACAGLGGKTLSLADDVLKAGETLGRVQAVEPNAGKVEKLRKAVAACGWQDSVQVHPGTLQEYFAASEEDCREAFDRVLVDAPCTGLGVIRRHPETRWRRTEADIRALSKIQRDLLDLGAACVRPGGVLVYSVCTFTVEEGTRQIVQFLERHPEFERVGSPVYEDGKAVVDWSNYTDANGDLALNPLDHETDAFYAVRLRRKL